MGKFEDYLRYSTFWIVPAGGRAQKMAISGAGLIVAAIGLGIVGALLVPAASIPFF